MALPVRAGSFQAGPHLLTFGAKKLFTPTKDNYQTAAADPDNGYPQVEDVPWLAVALRAAARLVDAYARRSTNPQVEDSVKAEAIYTQVAFWKTNGIAPLSGGVNAEPVLSAASLNGGSVSYAGAEKTAQTRGEASMQLCFETRLILGLAGCNPAPVRVVG